MPVLGDADKIMAGTGVADKVYMGATEVWPGDTTPPGPDPDLEWDFEGGTISQVVAEAGMDTVGSPVYAAGLVGAVGVDMVGSSNGVEVRFADQDHTGSLRVRVNAQHTSSAIRTILLKNSLYGWVSGIRHHNGGDLHVLDGTTAVEVLGDWRPYLGVTTRIEWDYTSSTSTLTWRFYADPDSDTPLWTSAPIVGAGEPPVEMITVGASGSPATTDMTVDHLQIWQ